MMLQFFADSQSHKCAISKSSCFSY